MANDFEKRLAHDTLHTLLTQLDTFAAAFSQTGAIGYDVVLLRRFQTARADIARALLDLIERKEQ